MQTNEPSRTAFSAARHRAVHQVLERGSIFRDPLAGLVLGEDVDVEAQKVANDAVKRRMRLFIAVRSRLAEDALAKAVARGVRQLVILGAGLDTFGYRNPHEGLQVFEVDHLNTQSRKLQLLRQAGIAVPPSLRFVDVDFEHQGLIARLSAAGFDPAQSSFFFWLGVVPYLTEHAIFETMGAIAGCSGGVDIVFDYGDPPETLSPEEQAIHEKRAALVASLGERWITYFEPKYLASRLAEIGFSHIHDLGPQGIARRFFPEQPIRLSNRGGHVILARKL